MPSSNENGWPSPSGGDAQQATAPSGDRAPKRDWGKVGALAGLAAVAVAVAVFLLTRGDSRPNSTSVNSGNSGVSCSASGGAKCEQTVQSLQQQSEDEILKQSSKVADGTPAGAGPWHSSSLRTLESA